jgi:ribosomal-protein-alanine N-acetyltransferase
MKLETPTLKTKRLILRPPSIEDADSIQKYFNNWNIVKNLSLRTPWPYPVDGAKTFLEQSVLPRMNQGDYYYWVISKRDNGTEAIGVLDFRNYDDPYGNRGFWLAEPFWGCGIMSKAVIATNDWIFNVLGVNIIIITNLASNIASRRIKEKTGSKYLGMISMPHHNGESETEKWELTKGMWNKYRQSHLS